MYYRNNTNAVFILQLFPTLYLRYIAGLYYVCVLCVTALVETKADTHTGPFWIRLVTPALKNESTQSRKINSLLKFWDCNCGWDKKKQHTQGPPV
uniref:Uncharacterized protein n=1 Tax=Anguilla anguilla TaxID=7936 RepID=A0A0E9WV52_ANGAN